MSAVSKSAAVPLQCARFLITQYIRVQLDCDQQCGLLVHHTRSSLRAFESVESSEEKAWGQVSSWNEPMLSRTERLPIAPCACWHQPDDLAAFWWFQARPVLESMLQEPSNGISSRRKGMSNGSSKYFSCLARKRSPNLVRP
jgi:hypothetical protein